MIRIRFLLPALLAAWTALAFSSADLAAQQRRGPGPRADRAELEQRVRARFAEMIKERLGLTPDQARRLEETVESFAGDRRRLFQDEQALRRRLEAVLIESDPSAEEAARLLDTMVELRSEEARLFQAEQEALLQVLDPIQLVRFHAMREQLARRIQQLRGGEGPPGVGPPGAGAGAFGVGRPHVDPWRGA